VFCDSCLFEIECVGLGSHIYIFFSLCVRSISVRSLV